MRDVVSRLVTRGAPALALLAVVFVDLATSQDVVVTSFVVVAPLLAAIGKGPADTAAYTALALVVSLVLGGLAGGFDNGGSLDTELVRLALVLVTGGLAVAAARARVQRERRLAQVLRVAEVAQQAVLVPVEPTVGPLSCAVRYRSAAQESGIGGDAYAALPSPWGARLLVADVRGKGLPAVRLASVVLGAFRERAGERADLPALLADLDAAVCRAAGGEDFVTAVLAQVDDAGCLQLLSAGHPPALLVRGGAVHEVAPPEPSPPLGLGATDAQALRAQLAPGDRLLLHTDGLSEARRPADRAFFPVHDCVARRLGAGDLDEALEGIEADVQAWCGGHLDDDVALLAAGLPG